MRVIFSVPSEAPPELCQAILAQGMLDPDKLKRVLFDYFVSEDRPQTFVLPRSILRETIETSISHMIGATEEFPKFELGTDASKFIRCCYASIWRALLLEWKARLILAIGGKPADSEFPHGVDPWIDLNLPENSATG
jgi:hypothetical protein